jgi:hypothetical protein
MATGREVQLTRQVGEHLVAAELGRRNYLAAPFAGNVPLFDLLAADVHGYSVPVQVKTIKGGSWQLRADTYLDIEIVGNRQILKGKAKLLNPELLCVFVRLKNSGSDEFYIFHLRDLQDQLFRGHGSYLKRIGGIRKNNPQSMHSAISPKELAAWRDNWSLVESSFAAQQKKRRL